MPRGADDVHAAIPPRHADRRDAGQTDDLSRRSAAVRPARPYRVRLTRVLCCWTNSLQLAAFQRWTVTFSTHLQRHLKTHHFRTP